MVRRRRLPGEERNPAGRHGPPAGVLRACWSSTSRLRCAHAPACTVEVCGAAAALVTPALPLPPALRPGAFLAVAIFFTAVFFTAAFFTAGLAALFFAAAFLVAAVPFFAAALDTTAFFAVTTFLAATLLVAAAPSIRNLVRSLTVASHAGAGPRPLQVAPVFGLRYLGGCAPLG